MSRTLSDFRNEYDRKNQVRKRLKDALAALRKEGEEEWRSERELIDAAGVSCKDIGELREEFKAHVVVVPSRHRGQRKHIWFADPKFAKAALKVLQ